MSKPTSHSYPNAITKKIKALRIILNTGTGPRLSEIFVLEINVQIYTNKTIIPPKNNKIIKYIIHLVLIVPAKTPTTQEVKTKVKDPNKGLFRNKDIVKIIVITKINNIILIN